MQAAATTVTALIALAVAVVPGVYERSTKKSRLLNVAIAFAANAAGNMQAAAEGLRLAGSPSEPRLILSPSIWEVPLAALRSFPIHELDDPEAVGLLRVLEQRLVSALETRQLALGALNAGASVGQVAERFDVLAKGGDQIWRELATRTTKGRAALKALSREPTKQS